MTLLVCRSSDNDEQSYIEQAAKRFCEHSPNNNGYLGLLTGNEDSVDELGIYITLENIDNEAKICDKFSIKGLCDAKSAHEYFDEIDEFDRNNGYTK